LTAALSALPAWVSRKISPNDLKVHSLTCDLQSLRKQITKILPNGAKRSRVKLGLIQDLGVALVF